MTQMARRTTIRVSTVSFTVVLVSADLHARHGGAPQNYRFSHGSGE